ncbi:hypothetical protein ACNOYE_19775 [Nannocystaceae bacterium ST9]
MLMCCSLILVACQAGSDEPPDAPSDDRQAEVSDPSSPPADLDTIAALLRARHADDLPSAEQLANYPSAEASLRELGLHGETMLVRTRALALLRHFDSPPTGALLAELASDAAIHPALRAAAVSGLIGQPLDDQPERLAIVVAALDDGDPRVGVAAVEVLDAFGKGRDALREAAQREDLSSEVRAAIERR